MEQRAEYQSGYWSALVVYRVLCLVRVGKGQQIGAGDPVD